MALSKQELREIAALVEKGAYVKRSTLYVAVGVALLAGLYAGNLLTTVFTHSQQAAVHQQAPARQVPPQQTGQILDLEEYVQKHPEEHAAWVKLGHLYFDTNQPRPAIRAYEKALQIKPGDADVLTDLGVMYRRDHQHRRAVETFDQAIAADPSHEVSRFNKGIVLYHDLNKKEEAFAAWQDLLRLNPEARTPGGTPVRDMLRQLQGQ